jgi:hypothetical protein
MSTGRVKGLCNGSNYCDHIPFFSGSATEVAESEEVDKIHAAVQNLQQTAGKKEEESNESATNHQQD